MEAIQIDQARKILTDAEARELMIVHQIEMGIDDNRSAVQYMAELLIYLEASEPIVSKIPDYPQPPIIYSAMREHRPYFA